MKSVVTPEEVTNYPWPLVSRAIIRADEPAARTVQNISIEAIIDAIHEPVLILDRKLNIQSINTSFVKKFKVSKKSIVGKPLKLNTAKNPQAEKFINQLKKLTTGNAKFAEIELTYVFNKIGERTLLVNAKQIAYENKQSDIILLSIEDIT